MRLIYRCPIIGNGSEDDEFRPYIADYRVKWAIHGEFPAEGTHCTVVVDAEADIHTTLQADPLIRLLDDSIL